MPSLDRRRVAKLIGCSPYSNVADVTTQFSAETTTTRFVNNSVYPIVSLLIDGVEQLGQTPMAILSGGYYEIALSSGTHTYQASSGFWDSFGGRTTVYNYPGPFVQTSGLVGTVSFSSATIRNIMTLFRSSCTWTGDWWDDNAMVHS